MKATPQFGVEVMVHRAKCIDIQFVNPIQRHIHQNPTLVRFSNSFSTTNRIPQLLVYDVYVVFVGLVGLESHGETRIQEGRRTHKKKQNQETSLDMLDSKAMGPLTSSAFLWLPFPNQPPIHPEAPAKRQRRVGLVPPRHKATTSGRCPGGLARAPR